MSKKKEKAIPEIKLGNNFNEAGSKFDEAKLDNEENLYESAANFEEKHLQQFYTPVDFASFLARCLPVNLSPQSHTGSFIVDPTSGSGNLLLPFAVNPANVCVGIEIDKNNIPEDSPHNMHFYNADFVKLSHYLNDINVKFPVLVLNPPFSLQWTEDKIESQLWTMKYAIDKMFGMGCGYIICLKSFADKITESGKFDDIKEKVIYRLNVKNLFKASNALVETSVMFFSPQYITPDITVCDLDYDNLDMSEMNRIAASIKFLLADSCFILHDRDSLDQMKELVDGCVAEYKKAKSGKRFDIEYRKGQLNLSLTNYKWHKIETEFKDKLHSVKEIHQKIPNYLALNGKVKQDVFTLITDGVLTISSDAKERIDKACEKSELVVTPFKALPPQQRLGYLTDHSKIRCKKTFTTTSVESGEFKKITFEAERLYSIHTKTEVNKINYEKTVTVKDNSKFSDTGYKEENRNFFKEVKALRIAIFDENNTALVLHENSDDIKFLIEHFDIPNPHDVASKFPHLHRELDARLRSEEFSKYTLKEYQIYDLARAGLKDSLILSWDQGGGKSRGALAWAELKKARKVLIICPQDLIVQWKKEASKFDLYLNVVNDWNSVEQALLSTEGYYITYYEFLSIVDVVEEQEIVYDVEIINWNKRNPDYPLKSKMPFETRLIKSIPFEKIGKYRQLQEKGERGITYSITKRIEYSKRWKGYSTLLKNAFKAGAIIVDEGVKIKTKDSKRGIAVRRLNAKYKLLLSGSPIKNVFVDIYYLFGWLFGYNTALFPYEYEDRGRFLDDFGTYEIMVQKKVDDGKRAPKLLPEINQISLFWRLISPCIVRRKKEDFGEELVDKNIHRIAVDFSSTQYEQYRWWCDERNFWSWFVREHPERKGKIANHNAKFEGQLWKMRFCSTTPQSRKVSSKETFYNPYPYTNKILTCLQIVNQCLIRDEQVIIFTNLQENAEFLQTLLGGRACTANGKLTPKKRSPLIDSFKHGAFPVLIAGIEAVNLGHSLENCSNVIMLDYVWEHSTTRQAIDRIHRINSERPVNVYLLYIKGSYDETMIEIVDKKGMSADYAIDGELMDQDQAEINFRMLLKESLRLFGELKTDDYLTETQIEKECKKILYEIQLPKTKKLDFLSSVLASKMPAYIPTEIKKYNKKKKSAGTIGGVVVNIFANAEAA